MVANRVPMRAPIGDRGNRMSSLATGRSRIQPRPGAYLARSTPLWRRLRSRVLRIMAAR